MDTPLDLIGFTYYPIFKLEEFFQFTIQIKLNYKRNNQLIKIFILATISLEDNYFIRLMEYSKQNKMSVQEVLHNLIDQLKLDSDTKEETNQPSWKRPLPQAIKNIMPKRKIVSFDTYEDYQDQMEKQLRKDYENLP